MILDKFFCEGSGHSTTCLHSRDNTAVPTSCMETTQSIRVEIIVCSPPSPIGVGMLTWTHIGVGSPWRMLRIRLAANVPKNSVYKTAFEVKCSGIWE